MTGRSGPAFLPQIRACAPVRPYWSRRHGSMAATAARRHPVSMQRRNRPDGSRTGLPGRADYGAHLARLIDLIHRLRPEPVRRVGAFPRRPGGAFRAASPRSGAEADYPAGSGGIRRRRAGIPACCPPSRPPRDPQCHRPVQRCLRRDVRVLRPEDFRADGAIGLGLDGGHEGWPDLQLDRADVTAWGQRARHPAPTAAEAALPLELPHPGRRLRSLSGDPEAQTRLKNQRIYSASRASMPRRRAGAGCDRRLRAFSRQGRNPLNPARDLESA
jgi:hypothetical protein